MMDSRSSRSPSRFEEASQTGMVSDRQLSSAMDTEKESTVRANLRALQADAKFEQVKVSSKRLIVHSICLENFKSYQGKQVIGPFDNVRSVDLEICECNRSKRKWKV